MLNFYTPPVASAEVFSARSQKFCELGGTWRTRLSVWLRLMIPEEDGWLKRWLTRADAPHIATPKCALDSACAHRAASSAPMDPSATYSHKTRSHLPLAKKRKSLIRTQNPFLYHWGRIHYFKFVFLTISSSTIFFLGVKNAQLHIGYKKN